MVALESSVPTGLIVLIDRAAMLRVLGNILNNAVEAKSSKVRIEVVRDVSLGVAALKVHDWGVGLSPEVRDKIGHAFSTHGKSEGTGLGLWHGRRILEAMSGRLDVASPGEQGAATTATLALREKAPA
jgi:signal transduction histidine kinase